MKNIALIVIITFSGLQLSAINFDGKLITVEGDTIDCQILFSDSNPYAHKGEILSTKKISVLLEGEKITYSADQLINYSVRIGTQWKTYWGVNSFRKKYQFMKREVNGKLTFYSGITFSSIKLNYQWAYVFIKSETSDKLYLEHGTPSNRQKLTEFIVECPVASGLIFAKQIDIGNPEHWRLVAQTYNEEC